MKKWIHTAEAVLAAVLFSCILLSGCGASGEADTAGAGEDARQEADGAEAGTAETADIGAAEDTAPADAAQDGGPADEQGQDASDDADDKSAAVEDESPATGYLATEHERTFKGIKAYLAGFSGDPAELVREGGLAAEWNSVMGMRNLTAFEERYVAGEETEIVLMQYTEEGDPILDYLYYDGEKIWHVADASRDAFGGPENAYREETYPYLLVFTQKAEERDRMHSLVLSKQDGLTYDEFTQLASAGGPGERPVSFIAAFFYTDADL